MSTDLPGRPGRDRRRGARFISAEPQANSTLIVGRKEFPARILDESAGGFCILVEDDPRAEADAVVRLRTALGCYEVRVASVGRGEANCPRPSNVEPRGYRLGLQRLRELEVTPLPTDKTPWLARTLHVMPGGSMAGAIVFILALVIAAPLTAVGVMFGLDKVSLKQFSEWAGPSGHPEPSRNPSRSSRRFRPVQASSDKAGVSSAAAPGVSSSGSPSLPNVEQIRTMLTHAPGAEALLLSDVVKYLALSTSQQQQLQELADATNQALDQFDQYTQGDSRQERARKRELLFNEARKQALRVLTPEQLARWETLQTR